MADNRKYYYLKLKENFFDSDSIVLLEDMKDGILYSNILLKLYLKSLKNGGKLQLDEHIPYTAQMIATLTRHQIGTVERALEIFRQLGLVEQLPDKWEYYIDRLSCHIASTGKQYHSHAATIYKWAQEDAAKGKAAPKQGIPDYSCKEGESL